MADYFSGLLLGFALITPIGAQNLFVLNQGLTVGFPRALIAISIAGLCDTTLILLGAGGASLVLNRLPEMRAALLVCGVVFLLYLGLRSLHAQPEEIHVTTARQPVTIAFQTVGVSLLNPHAILDTVGVIGTAIVAQPPATRTVFASGAVSASWLWFLILGIAGALVQSRLTVTARVRIEQLSGVILLAFAIVLGLKLW